MLHFPLWKKTLIWGVCLLGIIFSTPNLFFERVENYNTAVATGEPAEGWSSYLPTSLVNLGLDLRGGAHLLVEVQLEDVHAERMDGYWPEVRNALREDDTIGTVRRVDNGGSTLEVRIGNPDALARAIEIVEGIAQPVFSLTGAASSDIEVSGSGDTLAITLSETELIATDDRTMAQSVEIIRRRIDPDGTRDPTIQRQGTERILIQVPGIGSAEEVLDLIGKTAKLTFHTVVRDTNDPNTRAGAGNILLPSLDEDGVFYVLERRPVITGEHLVDARPDRDQDGRPAVGFRLNPTGGTIFGEYTAENIGTRFAIVLDDEVISAPGIRTHISGGAGIITSPTFTIEETTQLSILLRAGALPAEIDVLEQRTVGPDLGQDSIDAGRIAAIVAFIAVLAYMALSYGLFGIFANVALILNVALLFALLSVLNATLTLPGIAGIVLTVGMAVDANVLIFERIREEMKTAKGAARAVDLGYQRAFSAIIDANITTAIAALILFLMGSGPVKGFAVTLGLGILTSVFTAVFVTRLMLATWFEARRPKTVKVANFRLIPEGTKFNFFGLQTISFGTSMAVILISLGAFLAVGLNYGIDFRGGSMIMAETEEAAEIGTYRDILGGLDVGDTSVTAISDPAADLTGAAQNVVMIRIEQTGEDPEIQQDAIKSVKTALTETFPDINFLATESVGAKVSGELIMTGIIAVVLAVAAVLFYIWLRFEWQFSLGAVAALVHDVILTIGVFSLLSIEFNLSIIAAILTIVGYSLNDTVVLFDRVRENLRKFKTTPLGDVLNLSINETLSRTVVTSLTTLLALIALFVLGERSFAASPSR